MSSALVGRFITIEPIGKPLYNFLDEISSLPHSIVFLYFFALITEEGFLVSPCYSLELCIDILISFLFSFAFCISSFLSYLYGLLRHLFGFFAFLCFENDFDHCLLYCGDTAN